MTDPYRLCQAAETLKAEINARWPGRDKTSDGWIGDAAHATRSSDHNPWLKKSPPPRMGVVRALDIDVDGVDMAALMEHLRHLGATGDPRLINGGYLIFNERITAPDFSTWRQYLGTNPHTRHGHVSFTRTLADFDSTAPWGIHGLARAPVQEDDMTPDERKMLTELHNRVCRAEKAWPGGVTDDQNTPYDMRMMVNRANVEQRQAWREVKEMRAELGAALRTMLAPGTSGAPVDPDVLAEAVVNAMIERLR